MKERPILFSSPMVRAILAGNKTQTRRLIKQQPLDFAADDIMVGLFEPTKVDRHGEEYPGEEIFGAYDIYGEWGAKCPYGKPGDRLWVRETFADIECVCQGAPIELRSPCRFCCGKGSEIVYRATDSSQEQWKPSIFMPRWASRITLEITDIRVERLQDITEEDAKAEGIYQPEGLQVWEVSPKHPMAPTARAAFEMLWDSINGAGSWSDNPWVWVIEFKEVPK